jgi:hypothetical protein
LRGVQDGKPSNSVTIKGTRAAVTEATNRLHSVVKDAIAATTVLPVQDAAVFAYILGKGGQTIKKLRQGVCCCVSDCPFHRLLTIRRPLGGPH